MFTIYQNTRGEEHSFDSFEKRMIQICNEHRKNNRALAFAFILYDFQNPHIWKILNDGGYWLALHHISGKYITVFSLHYKEPGHTKRMNDFDGFNMLTSIPTNFNPSRGTNKLVSKYFGDDININYPAILFFQVDDNKIIDSLLIDLREEQIEPAFLELKEYMKKAVSALKNTSSESKKNLNEIFDCLEREVKYTQRVRKIKRVTENAGNIIGLISSIKGLF